MSASPEALAKAREIVGGNESHGILRAHVAEALDAFAAARVEAAVAKERSRCALIAANSLGYTGDEIAYLIRARSGQTEGR